MSNSKKFENTHQLYFCIWLLHRNKNNNNKTNADSRGKLAAQTKYIAIYMCECVGG